MTRSCGRGLICMRSCLRRHRFNASSAVPEFCIAEACSLRPRSLRRDTCRATLPFSRKMSPRSWPRLGTLRARALPRGCGSQILLACCRAAGPQAPTQPRSLQRSIVTFATCARLRRSSPHSLHRSLIKAICLRHRPICSTSLGCIFLSGIRLTSLSRSPHSWMRA